MVPIDPFLTFARARLDPRGEAGRFSIGGTLLAMIILAVIVVIALIEWVVPNH
jgi:hypothetical protein